MVGRLELGGRDWGDGMTTRFMILPIETINGKRGPKYLRWRENPAGVDVNWNMKDYGVVNWAVVAADLTTTQANQAGGQSDVFMLPANLDNTLSATAVNTAQTFLEAQNIPADWIDTGDTYRHVIKIITGMFLFLQALTQGQGMPNPFENGANLGITFGALSVQWQNAIVTAAIDSGIAQPGQEPPANWTMRQILKWMADRWQDKPIIFGELGTL